MRSQRGGAIGLVLVSLCLGGVLLGCDDPEPSDGDTDGDTGPAMLSGASLVVHCDPVRGDMAGSWEQLAWLVEQANKRDFQLSIFFTLSFARQALLDGHQQELQDWLKDGHRFGTHVHPEWIEEDAVVPKSGGDWARIPEERVAQAITEATTAVNELVGEENNRSFDSLLQYYGDAGCPAELIPSQFTHWFHGNNGYSHVVPIDLGDRVLIGVYYRYIPVGDASFADSVTPPKYVAADELIREASTHGGDFMAAVLHPGNLTQRGDEPDDVGTQVRAGVEAWMDWTVEEGVPSLAASDVQLPLEYERREEGEMLTTSIEFSENDGDPFVNVTVVAALEDGLEHAEVVVYLPGGFQNLDVSSISPPGGVYDQDWQRITWADQPVGREGASFGFRAGMSVELGTNLHPTASIVDAYLRDDDNDVRLWSLANAQTVPNSDGARVGSFSSSRQ